MLSRSKTGLQDLKENPSWLKHLKEKALHALFSLGRYKNLSKLKTSLACKIFDTMISPILTYNSEIWGVYPKPDLGQPTLKRHLQFCKRYLEVDNNGRLPLKITINHKILNYILYIKPKNEESFVKQAF